MNEPSGSAGASDRIAVLTPLRRVKSLDSIRGLAATYVLMHHAWYTAYPSAHSGSLLDLLEFGHYAVVVFIVLSGVSLGIAVVGPDGRMRDHYQLYLRRRLWRIVPPYAIALTGSAVLAGTLLRSRSGSHWDVVLPFSWAGTGAAFVFVQDLHPYRVPNHAYWSVPIELHLYLIVPLLVLIRRTAGIVGLLAAGAAVVYPAWRPQPLGWIRPSPFLFVFGGSLVCGLIAAELIRDDQGIFGRMLLGAGSCAGVLGVAILVKDYRADSLPGGTQQYAVDLLLSAGLGVVLTFVARRDRGWLTWSPLVSLGSFSYTLYLVHAPLIELGWRATITVVDGRAPQLAAFFGIVSAGTILIAKLVSRAIEQPFIRYRSFDALRRAGKRAPLAGPPANLSE